MAALIPAESPPGGVGEWVGPGTEGFVMVDIELVDDVEVVLVRSDACHTS